MDISNNALQSWRSSGKIFDLDGHRLFYRDEGDGAVLLMLHGFSMSSWDWKDVLEPFSENFRLRDHAVPEHEPVSSNSHFHVYLKTHILKKSGAITPR